MTRVYVSVPWYERKGFPGWVTDARGCDIWQGRRNNRGYGSTWEAGKIRYVHRLRYEREVGPIPPGMELDHFVCDNGAGGCCNPFHCRPVTHRENGLRGNTFVADNAGKTHCPKGHPLTVDSLVKSTFRKHGWRVCLACRRFRERKAK